MVEQWVERTFDASEGQRKAHAFSRGIPKEPPLPTEIWDEGRYVGHPHEIVQMYFREWGSLWGQPEYADHDQVWSQKRRMIKQLTKQGMQLVIIEE